VRRYVRYRYSGVIYEQPRQLGPDVPGASDYRDLSHETVSRAVPLKNVFAQTRQNDSVVLILGHHNQIPKYFFWAG
jgi:hypothetical protein